MAALRGEADHSPTQNGTAFKLWMSQDSPVDGPCLCCHRDHTQQDIQGGGLIFRAQGTLIEGYIGHGLKSRLTVERLMRRVGSPSSPSRGLRLITRERATISRSI